MSALRRLFSQTAIYGLATVLPRVINVLLVPLYTGVFQAASGYGEYTAIYAYIAICNVVLAYGMETAFFRFFHREGDQGKVIATALLSLAVSSCILVGAAFFGIEALSEATGIRVEYVKFTLAILGLDALTVIPFALIRARERPLRYTLIKVANVSVNLGLNVFFLVVLPGWASEGEGIWQNLYAPGQEIRYIFWANVIASGGTLLVLTPTYRYVRAGFDPALWRRMLAYALPVMVAGLAYTVNEVLDKILLQRLVSDTEAGIYGACYKLALFMTLYGTAFRMGVEPFFFSHAKERDAPATYAQITYYFAILGSLILVAVTAFAEPLARLLIRRPEYLEALDIVPIVLLASLCLGVYHSLSVWYKITDRTYFGALISCVGAVLTLVINFTFIESHGYHASAWATLAAYGSMMLLSYFLGRRYHPIPYRTGRILGYLSLAVLASGATFYIFERDIAAGALVLAGYTALVAMGEARDVRRIIKGP